MVDSRPFHALCCLTQAQIIQFCLTTNDLRKLGVWQDEWRSGFTPHVWSRGHLQRSCNENLGLAQHISDLLDLEFLDVIAHVRTSTVEQAGRLTQCWIEGPFGPALPSILWSLVSDRRDEVHHMGVRLGHEACARAALAFVAPPRSGDEPQTRTSPSTDSSEA